MNTKICLIKENVLAYKGSDYAVLSAGTPVRLINTIKDESGEDVATIEDGNGDSYKVLEANLIQLSSEEIKVLRDNSVAENCVKCKKIAQKIKPVTLWSAAISTIPILFLRLFNITDPSINVLFLFIFAIATAIPASIYIKNEKKGKYVVSEDYFLNFAENEKELEKLLEKEEDEEDYAVFKEEMEIERKEEEDV